MERVIIDTDCEFDDSMALILALKSKELKIEAITTLAGIRDLDYVTTDTLNLLELLGKDDIPVAAGMENRLRRDMTSTRQRTNNIWNLAGRPNAKPLRKPESKPIKEHGVDLIVSKIMETPHKITLITIGALTNVAMALLKEPQIAKNVKEVYTMGGALLTHGNASPVAEFNIWGDPDAAKIFFNSGMPITLVDLYTFWKPVLTAEQWQSVKNANAATRYTFENFEPWIEFLKKRRPELEGGLHIGDAVTVGVFIEKSLVETKKIQVDVETEGQLTSGQTIGYGLYPRLHPPNKEPNVNLCTKIDEERFEQLFMERVKS